MKALTIDLLSVCLIRRILFAVDVCQILVIMKRRANMIFLTLAVALQPKIDIFSYLLYFS